MPDPFNSPYLGDDDESDTRAEELIRLLRKRQAQGLALKALTGGPKGIAEVGQQLSEQSSRAIESRERLSEAMGRLRSQGAEARNRAEAQRQWQEGQNTLQRQAAMERAKVIAGGARAEKAQARGERDVQKLGEELGPLAPMGADLQVLEEAAKKADQPGFGVLAGNLPDWLVSEEGQALRQSAGRLINQLLFMQSGKVVTEQEVKRHLRARGLGAVATPEAFAAGVKALRRELETVLREKQARFPPGVVSEYAGRGGVTALAPPLPPPGGKGGPLQVRTIEEARRLPKGTRFLDPNGVERVR